MELAVLIHLLWVLLPHVSFVKLVIQICHSAVFKFTTCHGSSDSQTMTLKYIKCLCMIQDNSIILVVYSENKR